VRSCVLLLVEVAREGVEMMCPQAAVRLEPAVERLERTALEAIHPMLGGDSARHEAGRPQHLQVLGDGGLADCQSVHELADGALRTTELVQDAPPRRLRDDRERVHGLRFS
jgi:hypothetical protein